MDSIRIKILVLAVFATLLPSLATTWISYLENRHALEAKASEELQAVSAQIARELDLWLKERRYELRVFASSYEVTENVATRNGNGGASRDGRSRLTNYLSSVRERFHDYSELSVVDPNGKVVAVGGDAPGSFALPGDWQAQLRTDDFVVGAPYWHEAHAAPEMLLAVPIRGGELLLGAITANVNLLTLIDTLRGFAPGESGRVALLTQDGAMVVGSHQATAETMALRYDPEAIRALLAGEGVPDEIDNVAGQQALTSMRPVPGLSWIVAAELPVAEVFSQLASLRNVTLLIVAATLVLAAGVGYGLGMFIVRPLERLTRAATKVAGGDLDVDDLAPARGEVGYLTRVFNEMVERLRASRVELERLSVTDPLTGLDNRRRMTQALQNEALRSRRLKHRFVVLMADVDHFKTYNDTYGHLAGDEALQHVARILREETRDVDSVARFGGEEFFVLLPETNLKAATLLAENLRQRVAEQPPGAGAITVSIGIAEFPTHGSSGDKLIEAADAALYRAKSGGRDCVVTAGVERAKAADERAKAGVG